MAPLNRLEMKSIVGRSQPLAVIALCSVLIVAVSALAGDDLGKRISLMALILIVLIAAAVEMYVYLTSRPKFARSQTLDTDEASSKVADLERRLRVLRQDLDSVQSQRASVVFSPAEKEKLQKDLLSKLGERTVADLSKRILETGAKLTAMDAHIDNARVIAKHMLERLNDEVDDLMRRANINLYIGIGVTVVGVFVLVWLVLSEGGIDEIAKENVTTLTFWLVSRLSVIVLIEVFAYFFLRLYRYSLFEIKYFQNEITNSEFRLIALETAFRSADVDAIKKACVEMLRVERNVILKKGETTLSLRKDEIEQEYDKNIISILERFLAVKGKDKGKHAG
jgi:hypothetical protein